METSPQKTVKNLPHRPGVYIYHGQKDEILYIGKAKDLKKRVSQYFQRDDAVGPKTKLLVSQIARIETMETASEFDALLLEAKLIHDHTPKYNVVLKDDKSPLYVLFTLSESLPHVYTMRRTDLPKKMKRADALFGPFQSAYVVRSLLRHLRHTIPFCQQNRRTGKPCFYTHLGLCNPCPSEIDRLQDPEKKKLLTHMYRKNIFRLRDILTGKSRAVVRDLEKEMKEASRENRFEDAARDRDHIQNLYALLSKRYDPMLYTSSDAAVEDIYANELSSLGDALGILAPKRIECFDISNTGGRNATGSMVVLVNGRKDPGQYKKFRIRWNPPAGGPNDVAMMAEVVSRRISHPEWGKPDLIVIDGGKGQVTAVKQLVADIPVIGLAKRYEEIILPLPDNRWKILRLDLTSPALHVVERIRDEAHRFAITYHRLLRKKNLFKSQNDKNEADRAYTRPL